MTSSSLTNHNERYRNIRKLVKKHEKKEQSARNYLYDALTETYALGIELDAIGELEAFITQHDPKLWNKTAAKNPFQPLTKLIFDGEYKSNLSHYSSALEYCKLCKFNENSVKRELHNVGVAKLAAKARTAKSKSSIEKKYEMAEQAHIDWAKSQLDNRQNLGEFKNPNTSNFENIEQLQMAFVKVVNGRLKVVSKVKLNQSDIEKAIISTAGPQPKYGHELLVQKDYYELFKAADLFTRFFTTGKETLTNEQIKEAREKLLALPEISMESGLLFQYINGRWTARTVSELQSFKSVNIDIENTSNSSDDETNPLKNFDINESYFVDQRHCFELVEQFRYDGDWLMQREDFGFSLIQHDKEITFEFYAVTKIEKELNFRQTNPIYSKDIEFTLNKNLLVYLNDWESSYSKANNATKFPSILELIIDGDFAYLRFPTKPITKNTLANDVVMDTKFTLEDRFVKKIDLQAIIKAAIDYDWSLSASIITPSDLHSGLEMIVKTQANEKIMITIPLCISVTGELGQIADELVI